MGEEKEAEREEGVGIALRLLDNLWFWAGLILVIAFIYASWALIEALAMHSPPEILPKQPVPG